MESFPAVVFLANGPECSEGAQGKFHEYFRSENSGTTGLLACSPRIRAGFFSVLLEDQLQPELDLPSAGGRVRLTYRGGGGSKRADVRNQVVGLLKPHTV